MENKVESFVKAMSAAVEALAEINPDAMKSLVEGTNIPVGLRDTAKFNLPVDFVTREEISSLRRRLAASVAAEKWTEGFVFALWLVRALAV
jgi:hypothetical protein